MLALNFALVRDLFTFICIIWISIIPQYRIVLVKTNYCLFFLVSHFFAAPCCFWNKTISVHFWNQTSFQEWNTLSTFYDWLMKVVFHANVSLSGSTVQHIKVFVSCNKNVSCNMKKNSFYFYRCCMQHFSNRFCCIAHKKTYCSTVKFSKDIHSSNGVLHGHENVAPWPQDLFLMRS